MTQEIIYIDIASLIKIGFIGVISFFITLFSTPILTYFLYKYKFYPRFKEKDADWKKQPDYLKLKELHSNKKTTPRAGGIIIWIIPLFIAFLFYFLAKLVPLPFFQKLNFLSREQTWLPLFTLVGAGILGLIDDFYSVFGKNQEKGLSLYVKFFWQFLIAVVASLWFFYKLGYNTIHIPGWGTINIGIFYIPLAIILILTFINAVNITDGLDGLAGGVAITSFLALAGIAFAAGQIDLASFSAAMIGSLIAFLWFNIYPARFFMGDTGSLAIGATLAVLAMLENAIFAFFIIGFIFVLEVTSSFIQIISVKFFKKKIFKIAPLHHHFQLKGWPEPKIVMRFWLISSIFAVIGLIIGILGRG